ncbi:MAG: hypothetical protein HY276_05615 [Ignavibacteriales bacterium]|nr:hypothetical protein [Ignavibacteriales bacterium]
MNSRVLLAVAALLVAGCTSSKEAVSGKITGVVQVIGNEPFTVVTIQDAAGKVYHISTSREIEQRLRLLQGKKIELQYSELSPSPEGVKIVVKQFKEQERREGK